MPRLHGDVCGRSPSSLRTRASGSPARWRPPRTRTCPHGAATWTCGGARSRTFHAAARHGDPERRGLRHPARSGSGRRRRTHGRGRAARRRGRRRAARVRTRHRNAAAVPDPHPWPRGTGSPRRRGRHTAVGGRHSPVRPARRSRHDRRRLYRPQPLPEPCAGPRTRHRHRRRRPSPATATRSSPATPAASTPCAGCYATPWTATSSSSSSSWPRRPTPEAIPGASSDMEPSCFTRQPARLRRQNSTASHLGQADQPGPRAPRVWHEHRPRPYLQEWIFVSQCLFTPTPRMVTARGGERWLKIVLAVVARAGEGRPDRRFRAG